MTRRPPAPAAARAATLAVALAAALAPAAAHAQAQGSADPATAGAAPRPGAVDDAATTERLVVADPYLEVHTGPGRGYPVFQTVARGEAVVVTMRRTDWYRVRTPEGREGWVHRDRLRTTLTEAGTPRRWRDLLLDDYLARRVELGAGWGRFQRDPMLKAWTAVRLSDTLRAEGTVGQVQGAFSGTSYWHLDLAVEPWSDRRLSPSLGVGFGHVRNVPNASLVSRVTTDARLAQASLGVRWHLAERFVLRADCTLYTAFVGDTRSTEYRALSAGLAFFF